MDNLTKGDISKVLGTPIEKNLKFIFIILLVIVIFGLLVAFLIITGYITVTDPINGS